MNLTKYAVEHKPLVLVLALILTLGGVLAFFQLGQLEDPDYTVKQAVIITPYPGASPSEVELEVTDRIETAIQEIKELKFVESASWPGVSAVRVEIETTVWSDKLPQVWDVLRRKVEKAEHLLPPGAGKPQVNDDYGDVFGFQLVMVGDGFDYREMETYAKNLRKELIAVPGVARIDLVGVQHQVVYLDVSPSRLAQLGISEASIRAALQGQNVVVDAGHIDYGDRRYRIEPTGGFVRAEDIGELLVRPSQSDAAQQGSRDTARLLRIKDIGTVTKAYLTPTTFMMRYNGIPALGLSITNKRGVNIVDLGARLDERLAELQKDLPHGIELRRMNWQADAVAEAVDHFLFKFVLTVLIVLVVVWIAMGWRVSIIIGTGLVITVFGTFLLMYMLDIPLHRLSLGALVIALVMMVDNAIVVADGTIVRIKQGKDRMSAAIEAALKPARKLLGATIIGSIAFAPIFLSRASTGEYCKALFPVVAGALLLSWLVSVTFTPVQCIFMLPEEKGDGSDIYGSVFYRKFRAITRFSLDHRWWVMAAITLLFVGSLLSFSHVTQMFFPQSTMSKFMLDYYLPEGSRIEQVDRDLEAIRKHISADKRIIEATSYIGAGPPRFYLPVEPVASDSGYGEIIFSVRDYHEIDAIFAKYRQWLATNYPEALIPLRRFPVGPGKTWEFELRLSAPALTSPSELRERSKQIIDILKASKSAGDIRQDWRNRVQVIQPKYNQLQGRWAGIERGDIARATKRAYDGAAVGMYREGDTLFPILLRNQQGEDGELDAISVKSSFSTASVPLEQLVDDIALSWQDPFHLRYNRLRTMKIQASPAPGYLLSDMRNEVAKKIFSIELPPGWRLQWGGLTESEIESQHYLRPGTVPAMVITVVVLIWLFGAYRPAFIVLMIAPLAVVGMVAGLLITNTPFGFMALLGAMGLMGMMMKNAIVLLDEVKQNILAGYGPYKCVEQAAVARLRAVSVTAIKIALGLIPMVTDIFWEGLAVTIIFGVSIGAVLTLIGAPVLYAVLYRIPHSDEPVPKPEVKKSIL